MKAKLVTSVHHLQSLCNKEISDYFILFDGGLRSSKTITFDGEYFYILNHIDDSEEKLSVSQLVSNKYNRINEAIIKKAFYYWED